MANHKSALKRIRSNEKKRVLNRYQHKTTRNAIKALRLATDKSDATSKLSAVISMIDKLAKKNIIHDNKASNLKSKLTKHVAKLQYIVYLQKKKASNKLEAFFIEAY